MRKWRNCTFTPSVRSFHFCDVSGLVRKASPVRGSLRTKIRAESSSNGSEVRGAGVTQHKKSELSSLKWLGCATCRFDPAQKNPRRGLIEWGSFPASPTELIDFRHDVPGSHLTPRRLYFDFLLPSHFFGSSVVLIGISILSSSCACRCGSRKTLAVSSGSVRM